jgi:transglutaminase-like putative cysteine protease
MRYQIKHETILEFPHTVREHHTELRLTPRNDLNQKVHSSRIETDPGGKLGQYVDYFGNRVDYFCVIPPHARLVTRLIADVEPLRENPFDFTPLPPGECKEWFRKAFKEEPSLHDYTLHRSSVTPPIMKLTAEISKALPRHTPETPLMSSLFELMEWIPSVLAYKPGATEVHTELINAIKAGAGVCQDFANLFISVVRSWGIPVRYVMGYQAPELSALEGSSEIATHAWAEVLIPGGGWIGFDATHNLLANDRYIPVAVGRDSYDAAPQRGSFKGDEPGKKPVVHITITGAGPGTEETGKQE